MPTVLLSELQADLVKVIRQKQTEKLRVTTHARRQQLFLASPGEGDEAIMPARQRDHGLILASKGVHIAYPSSGPAVF